MQKLKSLSKTQWIAILIMAAGLLLMAGRVRGMLSFFREIRYAERNNFMAGNPSPDLLRPWMSLRYVAQAYAVPQKYLYDAAQIEPRPETSMVAIYRLNQHMRLGVENGQPKLLRVIRQAIIDYGANPVATGLLERHVEGWMTVQYIANSTGVPAERYLEALNIPAGGNYRYLTMELLADEVNYSGGPRQLAQDLQALVEQLAPQDGPYPRPLLLKDTVGEARTSLTPRPPLSPGRGERGRGKLTGDEGFLSRGYFLLLLFDDQRGAGDLLEALL